MITEIIDPGFLAPECDETHSVCCMVDSLSQSGLVADKPSHYIMIPNHFPYYELRLSEINRSGATGT
jgi:hypothetical protein